MKKINEELALRNLPNDLQNSKQEIVDAMTAAIIATSKSINPVDKKKKIEELSRLQTEYTKNGDLDNLIDFIKEANRPRRFFFFFYTSPPNSMREFANNVQENNFLKKFINKILSLLKKNSDLKSIDILEKQSTHAAHSPSIKKSKHDDGTASETEDDLLSVRSFPESDSLPNSLLESEPESLSSDNHSEARGHTTTKKKGRKSPGSIKREPQAEDPLRNVNPEKIIAFADMGRKIKLIKRDEVKKMLYERYGGDKPKKKKVESQEQEATPEQLDAFKEILVTAGYLQKLQDGSVQQVTFSEDESERETDALNTAASLIKDQNLIGLAHNTELKIAKWKYNSIQARAKELQIINAAYEESLPKDDNFINRLLENIKPHYSNITVLTFSEQHYPFSENVFNQLLERGLSDAEKINKLCGEILSIDTTTLLDKINKGLFLSGRTEVKLDSFIQTLKTRLPEINWSFDKLLEMQEELNSEGLKLDLNLIRTSQAKVSEDSAEENVSTVRKRPPAFLAQIHGQNNESEDSKKPARPAFLAQIQGQNTESEDNKKPARPAFLAQIQGQNTESEDNKKPVRPAFLAQIKKQENEPEQKPATSALFTQIRNQSKEPKAEQTADQSSSENASNEGVQIPKRPVNPMLAALKQPPKLKSKEETPTNRPGEQHVAQSFADKMAMLNRTMGGGPTTARSSTPMDRSNKSARKKSPTSPPIDISGKNKITVKSQNANFIQLVVGHLNENYNSVNQKTTPEGYEFEIANPKTTFTSTEQIKEWIRDFASYLQHEGYSPCKEAVSLEKYNPAFLQEMGAESLKINYSTNYESKKQKFEDILTSANVLFVRQGNQYTINKSNWNMELLAALKEAKYTDDCFNIADRALQAETDQQLARDVPVAKFTLNIPSAALRRRFAELFNRNLGASPESFLDEKQFMVIGKDKAALFESFLQQLSELNDDSLKGEYIHTDDPEFAELIKEKLQHRLKISIPSSRDSTEISNLFANTSSTRVAATEGGEEVIYYVDVTALKGKKEQFFNLAARHGLNIEYYDSETNQYKPIDDATDSQYQQTPPGHGTSKQGIFAPTGRTDSRDDEDKENIPGLNQ